jgi:SAM-dependent methyltransferase
MAETTIDSPGADTVHFAPHRPWRPAPSCCWWVPWPCCSLAAGGVRASGRFRRVGIDGAPDRVRRAVEALSIRPADRVLEVGCGNGWAVSLICGKLRSGRILAIDRSTPMIALAKQRNEEHIAAGKAHFRAIDLVALPVGTETYHKIFAVNVNTFWRRPVPRELALLKKLLHPKGSVYLFFESPAPRADDLAARVTKALEPNGWAADSAHLDGKVMMIRARPAE